MHRVTSLLTVSALALGTSLGALPARADVSPDEVWDNVQEMVARMGMTLVAASEDLSGDTLRLTGVNQIIEIGPNRSISEIDEIRLIEQRNGSVRIEISPDINVRTKTQLDEETMMENVALVRLDGFEMIASGDPDDITYKMTATKITSESSIEATDETPMTQKIISVLTGLSATARSEMDDEIMGLDATGTADTYEMQANTRSDEAASAMVITAQSQGVTLSSQGSLPPAGDEGSFAALLSGTGGFSGGYAMGPSQISMQMTEGDKDFAIDLAANASRLDVALAEGVVRYGLSADQSTFAVQTKAFPPVQGGIAGTELAFTMPLAKSDEAKDLGLRLVLDDLTFGDTLWGMFDPAGQLPRDPADLVVDITGKGALFFDLFDPSSLASAEGSGDAPGYVESAQLNQFSLSLLGAAVDAAGGVVFGQTDDGQMLPPAGTFDVQAKGVQTLIETLQTIGLVPPQMGMGALLMLGTYALPGDEPDSFTSTIVLTDDGHITANGQPVK